MPVIKCDNKYCFLIDLTHSHRRGELELCCSCTNAFDIGVKAASISASQDIKVIRGMCCKDHMQEEMDKLCVMLDNRLTIPHEAGQ